MKQILFVVASLPVLMLASCTVAPSMLGDNVAGMVGVGAAKDLLPENVNMGSAPAALGTPVSTGSIVPLRDEGAVVDLPDASARMQASSSYRGSGPQILDEPVSEPPQMSSSEERHRQELINRGDLPKGQSRPVQ